MPGMESEGGAGLIRQDKRVNKIEYLAIQGQAVLACLG